MLGSQLPKIQQNAIVSLDKVVFISVADIGGRILPHTAVGVKNMLGAGAK